MYNINIFLYSLVLVLVKLVATGAVNITFNLSLEKKDDGIYLNCDHQDIDKYKYTVLEGEEFNININYKYFINQLICHDYNDDQRHFISNTRSIRNHLNTFQVEKGMGTLWNCTMLVHKEARGLLPVVWYNNEKYVAAYSYMKLHIRQKKAPLAILVNNVALDIVRTKSLNQDIDFTAEYQYVDGELVNVTCANFLNTTLLTMTYDVPETFSDNSNRTVITSDNGISLIAKLNSSHSNTSVLCIGKEQTDDTKVMVRFTSRPFHNDHLLSMELLSQFKQVWVNTPDKLEFNVEFEVGELMDFTCKPYAPTPYVGFLLVFMRIEDSDIYASNGTSVLKRLNMTDEHDNAVVTCYKKLLVPPHYCSGVGDQEIKMILHKKKQ